MSVITDPTINRIISLLQIAGESIKEASAIFVASCKADPGFYNRARESAPWVRESTWDAMMAIGEGRADWRVATGVAPHSELLAKLPLNQQEMILKSGVEMPTGSGDTVHLPLAVVSKEQAKVAFSGGKIRTPSEIANANRAPLAKAKSAPVSVRWKIRNGCLVVLEPCTISKADIAEIYGKMVMP